MRALFAAMLAGIGVVSMSPASAADCGPTGLYEGTGQFGDKAEVTLNIYCQGGVLKGQTFTSIGDFPVEEISAANGHINMRVDTYTGPVEVDLALDGKTLSGPVGGAGSKDRLDLVRKADSKGANALTPTLALSTKQWREDLRALAIELPKRHANAFFFLPKDKFEARVAAIDSKLGTLSEDQIFVAMAQLINAIGDGHTMLVSPDDRADLPVRLEQFDGQFRITGTSKDYTALLGAKVTGIDGMPIDEAHTRAMTLTPAHELPELREGRANYYLTRGLTLHGLGITKARNIAHFTLENDQGEKSTVAIKALPPGGDTDGATTDHLIYASNLLRLEHPDDALWCKALPKRDAVYCNWRSYRDLKDKAAAMFALIDKSHAKKLILDMRDNGGGDNTVGYAHIVKPLESRADLNKKGHLYVLIGAFTFSAAMNNAAQFSDETNAILVGQRIGEKPNSFQEPRQFRLPNSHLIVRASTLYYEFRKTGKNEVAPDKTILPSWKDVTTGRDPVLEWALAQPLK